MTNVPETCLPSEHVITDLSLALLLQSFTFASANCTPVSIHLSKSLRFSLGRSTRAYGLVSVRSSLPLSQTVAESQIVSKQSSKPIDSNSSIHTP